MSLNLRSDFPIIQNNPELIYFDSAATTLKPQPVIDAVLHYYTQETANIHRGDYDASFHVSRLYDLTRETVAKLLNAKRKEEIVFTSGATASFNMAAQGLKKYVKPGDVILTTQLEHASSILPWFKVAEEKGAIIKYIPLDAQGNIDLAAFENCFAKDKVRFVVCTMLSNVLGCLLPIQQICAIAHKYQSLCIIDAAQAVPHLKVDVQQLDADFLAFSAHKLMGPSGVGVLYGKYSCLEKLEPYFYGGGANARFNACGQLILKDIPECFEAGTPPIEGVLGLKAACEYLLHIGMDEVIKKEQELRDYLFAGLKELTNIELINPHSDLALASFNVKGIFAQDVGSYLNAHQIAVRTGNHCAKILVDITGVSESVRASLYIYNTFEEIDRFLAVLKDISLEKCLEVLL